MKNHLRHMSKCMEGSPAQIDSDTDSVVDILQSIMIHNNVPSGIPQQTLQTNGSVAVRDGAVSITYSVVKQKEDLSLEIMVAEKIQNIPAISFYPEEVALLAVVNIGGGSQQAIIRADNRAAVTKAQAVQVHHTRRYTLFHITCGKGEIWAAMRSTMDKHHDAQYQIELVKGHSGIPGNASR
ncbi:hypothetical protein BJ742DRAFT_802011 [Cladochytrium replicatum]|nr:hypothetical protein BJ742DRAFT_802011 [Cladochytrium replicatum]